MVTATVDDDVISALVTASRALIAISARSLAGVEDTLTLSEFRALVVLESQGPATPISLAAHLDLGHGPTCRIVERIHDEEWVHFTSDGAYAVTSLGADLVASVTRKRRLLIAEVTARMEADERQALVDALIAFARATGEPLAVEA
ncbi:MarR family winged helix-turn-helix transcriptional regulator [Nocardioides bigeumensis]|uniref:MarR family transcriptional regulator n=1 Tax=Nocardioides bigeumensis TaxID=433657 RepID=A0ABN2XMQ8_9ACTN